MTTLREAAQQALEALEEVQKYGTTTEWFDERLSALRAALAESVQEPVAMLWQHRETGRTRVLMPNERTATDVAYAWDVVGPLYLAPPKRKPLTEEEIALIVANCSASAHRHDDFSFARAIERAHGIK